MWLADWFRNYRDDRKLKVLQDRMTRVDMVKGESKPVSQTDEGMLFRIIAGGKCPNCGQSDGFFEGPSGGMSTNVYCRNPECTQGYNVTEFTGTAELIGKGKDIFPEWWTK